MITSLYDHQLTAVDNLSNGKVLWGGVGSGKSRVACAYYAKYEAPRNVYVITTAKKRDSFDWQGEFVKFKVGRVKSGPNAGCLVVDSWNKIHEYVNVKDAFFIFDEQRLVGSGVWVRSFLKIVRANHWIMLSATPGDSWRDYIPLFLAHNWYASRTEFNAKHVIFKPFRKFPIIDRYVNESVLEEYRSRLLVEMPFLKTTRRHVTRVEVSYDVRDMQKVARERWNVYDLRPIREPSELFHLMRKVVNSHKSRVKAVTDLVEEHNKLIVFYNFNYELDMLRKIPDIEIKEWNGHKHDSVPCGDKWLYLVQFAAGSEGWNCITTNAMILYSLPYSYKQWTQAFGRIDRLNTSYGDLYYYVLFGSSAIEKAIMRALDTKRNFNERIYLDKTDI